MSLNGINNAGYGNVGHTRPDPRERVEQARVRQTDTPQTPATPAPPSLRPATLIAPQAGRATLPVEPPPGTDPELWSVLSADDRAFFAKAGAMGPLTYGRVMHAAQSSERPAIRGGRLDVKV